MSHHRRVPIVACICIHPASLLEAKRIYGILRMFTFTFVCFKCQADRSHPEV
jgi:hypothetical protein